MNEKEIEFIKHCGEHVEFLTGGRGHSKTKQIIEQLQQENEQLKEQVKDENTYCEEANKWYKEAFQLQNNWNELKKWLENGRDYRMYLFEILDKMQELEGNNE